MTATNNDKNDEAGLDNPAFESDKTDVEKNTPGNEPSESTPQHPEEKERAQWGNGLEFLMSCIAMSVGLGNIWRFPFTAYNNGGGAFLIPYLIVLTVIGRPLYYMEMALGQFSAKGNVKFFKSLSPYLQGVGYAQVIASLCVATYYCSLMAITLFYFCNSFTGHLPWAECYNTTQYIDYLKKHNYSCVPSNQIGDGDLNAKSSSLLFFKLEVLKQSDDISEGIGMPEWRLTLCLLASWLVTFLVTVRGVKSSGKASYFLALFPYVIMITLLIRAATLEGAAKGMFHFIDTDWNKLADPEVWYAAVTQCFFSLNVGFGSIIMFSSHNDFRHNINRDAIIITTLDTFTSLLSGVTIFGILGNLAHNLGVEPDEVIGGGGTGLAFISYPDAISKFEAVPWLFAILFFFMLFVLGIGSLAALQGTVNTVLKDNFPNLASWKVSAITATVGFLIGLIYVTPGGQYMLDLVDYFGGTFIIYVFVIAEVTGVVWVYGLENFCLDMEYMLKSKVGVYWRVNWGVITPGLLIVIFVYFLTKLKPMTYGDFQLQLPDGIYAFGWCILGVSLIQFVMWIAYYIITHRDEGWNKVFGHEKWAPYGREHQEEWRKFKEDALAKSRNKSGNWLVKKMKYLIGR